MSTFSKIEWRRIKLLKDNLDFMPPELRPEILRGQKELSPFKEEFRDRKGYLKTLAKIRRNSKRHNSWLGRIGLQRSS